MKYSRAMKPIGASRPTRRGHADESMMKRVFVPRAVDNRLAKRHEGDHIGHMRAIDAWRRTQRDAMIYLDYTKAEDKSQEAERLRDYWGFKRVSTIEKKVAQVRMQGLPAEYLSEDHVIRDRRRLLILKDADRLRNTLNDFILALQKLDPDEWLEMEQTAESSGKGQKTKIRKIKARDLTIQLFEKLMKMHQGESVALDPYVTPVPRRHEVNIKSGVEGKSDSQVEEFHKKLKNRRFLLVQGPENVNN